MIIIIYQWSVGSLHIQFGLLLQPVFLTLEIA